MEQTFHAYIGDTLSNSAMALKSFMMCHEKLMMVEIFLIGSNKRIMCTLLAKGRL
jgi:hypothetical protein